VNLSEEQLIDLWDSFADFIDVKNKQDSAMKFVNWCVDNGAEESVLYAMGDQDPYLKEAVEEVYGSEGVYDNDYDDEDYDDRYDSEDY
jgi:hypothetical protein